MAARDPPSLRSLSGESRLVIGLVSGAEFVNHTYLVLLPPILGLLSAEFDVSLSLLGLAMGAQGAATAVFQLPFGYLSDHYDRKLSFALSLGLGGVGAIIVALAPSYAVLTLGLLVLGTGIAGHHPTHLPLLSEATSADLRGRAFSMRGFAGNLGFAFPPVLMTAVVSYLGLSWRVGVGLLAAFGLCYGAVTLLAFHRYVSTDVTGASATAAGGPAGRSLLDRVTAAARSLTFSPPILAISALSFLKAMAGWGITSFTVVLLTTGYGLGFDVANLTLTAMFLTGAVMILVGGALSDRFRPGLVIVAVMTVVGGLSLLVGSLLVPPLVAIVLATALGGIRSVSGPARTKLADAFSSRSDLGQTFALITIGSMIGTSLSPPILGTIIDVLDVRVAFGVVAAFAFLAAGITVLILHVFGDGVPRLDRASVVGDDD